MEPFPGLMCVTVRNGASLRYLPLAGSTLAGITVDRCVGRVRLCLSAQLNERSV